MSSSEKKRYFFLTPLSSMARSVIYVPFPRDGRRLHEAGLRDLQAGYPAAPQSASPVPDAAPTPARAAETPSLGSRPHASPSLAGSRSRPHARALDRPA